MYLRCQSNTFPFFDQSNSGGSFVNFGFSNVRFSSATNIFPDGNLNSFFRKFKSIETPFNDSNHPIFIHTKYHDISDFDKLSINKS